MLNVQRAIHCIAVAKSKMYWQVVNGIAFGIKMSVIKKYFLLP